MPSYVLTAPDGKKYRASIDHEPTPQEWDELTRSIGGEAAPEPTSSTGALARAAGESVLPSAGAWAGATQAARAAAALPIPHPIAKAVAVGGAGLVGGLLGAWSAGKAQRLAAEELFPKATERLSELQAADAETHPVARFAGSVAGALPTFTFAPLKTVGEIATLARGGEGAGRAAASLGGKVGAGAVMGAGGALLEGEKPTFAQIAESAAFPLLLGGPRWSPKAPTITATKPTRTGSITVTGPKEAVERVIQSEAKTEEPIPVEAKAPIEAVTPEIVPETAAVVPEPIKIVSPIEPSPQVQSGEIKAAGGTPPPVAETTPPPTPVETKPAIPETIAPVAETVKPTKAAAQVQEEVLPKPITPEPGPGVEGMGAAVPKEFAPEPVIEKGPLPDPGDWSANKKTFAQPFGFEKVPVLGKLFGGVRRMNDYIHESLATYWGVRGKGRAISSALGNEYSWLDKVFPTQKGRIANLPGIAPENGPYISDFFEALQKNQDAFALTPEQRAGFNSIQQLEPQFGKLESKYNVGRNLDTEGGETSPDVPQKGPYFPRIVVKRPGNVVKGLFRGTSVGSKPFFEKPRIFNSEAEGWQKGYSYEESISSRIATRAERLYKRIADRELANDPALGSKSPTEVMAGLRETFAGELASGEMTEKQLQGIAAGIEARGRVYQPAFYNKIFPEDTAQVLNRAFPNSNSVIRTWAASVNNALKGMTLGMDMGVGFIQGQALLARHPGVWAKANANAVRAMFSKDYFPNYVRSNLEPIRELAQLGSGIGRLEEYMAGLGKGELLTKVPVVGKGVEAFGRQFHTFLDVAKVEMWKGLRESTPKSEWPAVAQALESVLMSGRMESVGISGTRAVTERALLLAPAYYRGGLNMIAGLAEKGVSGQVMRQAMTAYATGGAVLFYGVAKALGMSDEEIQKRFNPMRSDFMLWKLKTGDKTTELGFGGFYRSLIRLMGNTAKTSLEHPENWASLAPDKNPITKWYRGHAGPLVSLTWNQFSGKDYLGRDVDLRNAVGAVTPLTLAATRPEPGQPKPSKTEVGASFFGLSGFTKTNAENLRELRSLHTDWQRKNPDPKVRRQLETAEAFNKTSDYRALDNALATNDLEDAVNEYRKLLAGGRTPKIIMERYQPIGPLFNDSVSNFFKFRKTLKPAQKKILQGALDERKQQWQRFRAMRSRSANQPAK